MKEEGLLEEYTVKGEELQSGFALAAAQKVDRDGQHSPHNPQWLAWASPIVYVHSGEIVMQ